ncbi:MAG: DUF6382 domain-containing protein [Clostridiales Family XIII bacterium]|jgi:hypothetical protein|nr:DUF6382 domain-containing protein [Clostridiales Family XIII bacterium]
MIKITIKNDETAGGTFLPLHEREILKSGACSALVPCTVREGEGATELFYDTKGFVSFKAFPYSETRQIYRTIRSAVEALMCIQDHLLRPDRLFVDTEQIFLNGPEGGAMFVYGNFAKTQYAEENDPVRRMLRPILAEFAAMRHLQRAQDAVRDLAVRLGHGAPGYAGIFRQIAISERTHGKTS